jgi:UDP-N-acetylglucosamine acyltransferase
MSNSIHPTALISGDVEMGSGNTIGPFAVIMGPAALGDDNWIGTGVVIGAPPEARAFTQPRGAADSPGSGVVIGSRNVLREYSQLHQGWHRATRVGDDSFVMNQAYIAHDCELGDEVTLASSVLLAGHVVVGEGANVGLGAVVHQRVRIGAWTMVGMGSVVTRDVPPFAKAFGNPARTRSANSVGMERRGFSATAIAAVVGMYDAAPPWDYQRALEEPETAPYFSGWNTETS